MGRNRRYRGKLLSFGKQFSQTNDVTFKGVVKDVITDNEHPLVEDGTLPFGRIGYIQFLPMNDLFSSAEEGLYAAPYDKNFKTIPVKNERVDIIKTTTGYVYRRNSATLSPYTDGVGDTLAKVFRTVKGESSNDASSYNSTSNTGIANKTDSGDDETSGFGEYFESGQNDSIHQLKLFEGDTVIQSRFGQSIRFSGYNNSERKLHPKIIIRNR